MLRARGGVAVAMAALAVVSCSSGGDGGAGTLPTVVGTVASSSTVGSTPSVEPTSPPPPPSVVEVSTSAVPVTAAPGVVGLSPDGPWRLVDSAPGVTTPGLVYELMPKLWAVIQVEETDQSTYSWTLNEADRPIIEAYLQAQLTYFTAVTSDPIDLTLSGWSEFFVDGGASYVASLEVRRNEGQVADLDLGVILRPQVLGDERTETTALVADCMIDGGVFRLPDGALAAGSTLGRVDLGLASRQEYIGGTWLVREIGTIEGGCL